MANLCGDPESLSTPEAEAAYEALYGPVSPCSGPVWQPGDLPEDGES